MRRSLALFVGSALLALDDDSGVPVVAARQRLRARRRRLVPFIVTAAFNVPLNDQLNAFEP